MVADRENAALAATLIEETCLKQGIEPQVLTLHSDRGAPMTSKCTAHLLADLGVTRSLSRPQVSDDNPFSEAQFKTLKYHPGFPGRFEDITAAIAFCRSFFPWYNTEHRHAGIAMLTPDDVHHHRAPGCAGSARTYPASRLGPSPRTLRPRHLETRPASRSRLDQPTRHFHNRRNESVNRNRRCLKVVDRFRSTRRTQCRVSVPQAAARIRKAAERNPKERLTALFHHITPDALGAAYFALKKDAAAGVDGVTWDMYGEGLDERLLDLHRRLHRGGAYRAPPVRRVEMPKPDGGENGGDKLVHGSGGISQPRAE